MLGGERVDRAPDILVPHRRDTILGLLGDFIRNIVRFPLAVAARMREYVPVLFSTPACPPPPGARPPGDRPMSLASHRRHAPVLTDISDVVPFASAEEAWFWTMAGLSARAAGARIVAGLGVAATVRTR